MLTIVFATSVTFFYTPKPQMYQGKPIISNMPVVTAPSIISYK